MKRTKTFTFAYTKIKLGERQRGDGAHRTTRKTLLTVTG